MLSLFQKLREMAIAATMPDQQQIRDDNPRKNIGQHAKLHEKMSKFDRLEGG